MPYMSYVVEDERYEIGVDKPYAEYDGKDFWTHLLTVLDTKRSLLNHLGATLKTGLETQGDRRRAYNWCISLDNMAFEDRKMVVALWDALGPLPYDFFAFVADPEKASKPEAKELAEKVWLALDKLAGAWNG